MSSTGTNDFNKPGITGTDDKPLGSTGSGSRGDDIKDSDWNWSDVGDLSFIPITTVTQMVKTKVPQDLCNKLRDFGKDKIVKIKDNLYDAKRTDWQLHTHEGGRDLFLPLVEIIGRSMTMRLSYPGHNLDMTPLEITLMDSWVAWYHEKSQTVPHIHFKMDHAYSYALYISTGENETSSITFMQPQDGLDKKMVTVRNGDLLIFPAHLYHYTFDMANGRIVASGNFACLPAGPEPTGDPKTGKMVENEHTKQVKKRRVSVKSPVTYENPNDNS